MRWLKTLLSLTRSGAQSEAHRVMRRPDDSGSKAYKEGMELFNRDISEEAAKLLEEAASLSPSVAQVHFSLAACCIRVATKHRDKDATHRAWIQRGIDAFEMSVTIAEQHGGLAPHQVSLARDTITNWGRLRGPPIYSEQMRRRIYFDMWETAEQMSPNLNEDVRSAKDLQACLDRAVAAARRIAGAKHGISEQRIVEIDDEGKAKSWPQPKLK